MCQEYIRKILTSSIDGVGKVNSPKLTPSQSRLYPYYGVPVPRRVSMSFLSESDPEISRVIEADQARPPRRVGMWLLQRLFCSQGIPIPGIPMTVDGFQKLANHGLPGESRDSDVVGLVPHFFAQGLIGE